MKILVTGATGFIGNHLIDDLLKVGGIDIISSSRDENKASKFKWFEKTKYKALDIDKNNDFDLFQYFDKPDKVIHLAWDGLPKYNDLIHLEKNLLNNYFFLKNLISNGLNDVTIIGTCFEYGLVEGNLSEDMLPNPSNSYAIAKDSLRKFIVELKRHYNFNYKWVRLFYMYGEGQGKNSLLSLLDKAIKSGEKEFNMSGGEQLRDYLHIEEVIDIIRRIAVHKKFNNEIINCCSGKPISVKKLVNNYLQEKNYKIKLNLGYYPYPEYEPMAFWGDKSKLSKLLDEI